MAATIEHDFETARARAGLPTDAIILEAGARVRAVPPPVDRPLPTRVVAAPACPTLGDVYEAYMADPTREWSPRTRFAYETTRRIALAVLGADTPVRSITRAHCRNLFDTLRWLPRNASKLHPHLGPIEIAADAKARGRTDLISPSNINAYLNKLCGVFNWAVKEEMIDRNPAQGLKVPDPTLRREKRLPFSAVQLQAIFSAPLYSGCRDDGHGYAVPGSARPRNARFWIPLIALYCGLRLNEACQLDVADVKEVEKTACFAITEASDSHESDKRLKTASSTRLVPLHPQLLALGLMAFVQSRRQGGDTKLFPEISPGATGYRSAAFSAWFARFVEKAGASSTKTCFHSFRHTFRDALREARVERDIALALGGWVGSSGNSSATSVADSYGSGYRVSTLFEALSRVSYPGLDVSHLIATP